MGSLKSEDFVPLGSRMCIAICPLDPEKLTFLHEVWQNGCSWNVQNRKGLWENARCKCNDSLPYILIHPENLGGGSKSGGHQ